MGHGKGTESRVWAGYVRPSLRPPSLMPVARVPLFFLLLSLALPAAAQLRLSAPLPTSAKASGGGTEFYLEPVTSDGALGFPVGVAASPDGRLFVAEKNGRVKVVHADGTVPSTPFLDLPDVYPDGDRGLLGIELHPDFPETPWVYVLYSVDDSPQPRPDSRSRGYGRLERYRLSESNPDVADLSSRQILFGESYEDGIPSCFNSHTIGTVAFGHDGSLFVGAGDGASWAEVDPGGLYPECFGENLVPEEQDQGAFRAQWTASLAGKILRLDPETGEGLADNPFYTGDPTDPESKVWALGLRNPFRFTVGLRDPNLPTAPGELFIGDVGWGSFEEINRARGGENFGWPCREGPRPLPAYASATPPNAALACEQPRAGVVTGPLAYFHHYLPDQSSPGGRVAFSITGGAFWDGDAYPERFQRRLFFADYSTGWVLAAEVNEDGIVAVEEVLSETYGLVDLTQDPVSGLLLAVDIAQQRIVRLQHSGSGVNPPVARAQASLRYGVVPASVEFTSEGTFDPAGGTLTYEWSFGDNTGATGTRVTHRYDQPGTYGATLTVTNSSGLTSQTTIPVTIGNSMPEVEVLQPTSPL
ncbi:MAG TPA: PKD domain-containing protein, partial [Bacteroidetes bacterium]|nr:PKD domain-containing protein [Bacteroidota bacterium]